MKLTKTQSSVLLKYAGKITHTPYTVNHEFRAEGFLTHHKLIEPYSFDGIVCGKPAKCYGKKITEAGRKLAETL